MGVLRISKGSSAPQNLGTTGKQNSKPRWPLRGGSEKCDRKRSNRNMQKTSEKTNKNKKRSPMRSSPRWSQVRYCKSRKAYKRPSKSKEQKKKVILNPKPKQDGGQSSHREVLKLKSLHKPNKFRFKRQEDFPLKKLLPLPLPFHP